MEPFRRLEAIAAPLPVDNIDTDTIFPGRFAQKMEVDYAAAFFADWRSDPGFVLNRAEYRNARILVAGANFGCGSSREHAVWALAAYGIRAVIARSFGDIFRDNCVNNGVLAVALGAEAVAALAAAAERAGGRPFVVDLETQTIVPPGGMPVSFEIDAEDRRALLEGRDAIARTLEHADEIDRFQALDRTSRPWIYAVARAGAGRS